MCFNVFRSLREKCVNFNTSAPFSRVLVLGTGICSVAPMSTETEAKYIRGEGADNNGTILKIQVVDPQLLGTYVTYKVNTETDRKQFDQSRFTVVKRYSDFDWLRQHLVRTYPGVIVPPLPEKSLIHKSESAFVEMRRRSLQTFLNRIANHEVLCRDETFRRFLQDSADMFALHKKTMEEVNETKTGGLASKLFTSVTSGFRNATRTAAEDRPKTDDDLLFDEIVGYVGGLTPQLTNVQKHTGNLVLSGKELSSAMFEFGEAFKVLGNSEVSFHTSHNTIFTLHSSQCIEHIPAHFVVIFTPFLLHSLASRIKTKHPN